MTGELLDMKEDNNLVVKFTPVDNDIKKNLFLSKISHRDFHSE